jgi:hypothetical protein
MLISQILLVLMLVITQQMLLSNFFGFKLVMSATGATYSNFFGSNAGQDATGAK